MAGRTNLRQIAAEVGVSTATVSLALRNSGKISAVTREKVRAAAERLGYRPDPLIAALSGRRRERRQPVEPDVIAYLTAYPTREGWRDNRFAPAAYEGACARAAQRGYRVEHFWLREPQMTPRRLASILQARGILGVCVAPFPEPQAQFAFPWDGFCAAAIGYSMTRPALHRACPHQYQGMQLVLTTLRQRGYQRIGVALGKRVTKLVAQFWIASVLMFQHLHGAGAATFLVYEESDRKELQTWLGRQRPDALVVSDVALIEWLRETGVRAPEDVGLALLERYPEHAGLDQKPGMVGAAAIDMIVGMIQRNETGLPADPKVLMVEGAWLDGPTARMV